MAVALLTAPSWAHTWTQAQLGMGATALHLVLAGLLSLAMTGAGAGNLERKPWWRSDKGWRSEKASEQ